MKLALFLFMAAMIGFCFYLMVWDGQRHKAAQNNCEQHGYESLGGRDYTLCVDPKSRIVYYLK